jgi:two-component system, cell cycle sensor histidine kinase and response regulator CckA
MIASALPKLDANRSFRVLLVEDDAENAGLARQRLSEIADYSFEVLQVSRLSEAIAALEKMTVDAALLGLDLPDSSGIETLRRLRELRPNVAVIVLAGDGADELCSIAMQEGALEFLRKSELGSRLMTRTIVHALERLRAQNRQRQIEALLSVNPEAVVVIDKDGKVHLANAAALDLFGKDRSELVDKDFGLPLSVGKVSEVHFLRSGKTHTAVLRVVDCEWEEKPAFLASIRAPSNCARRRRWKRSVCSLAALHTISTTFWRSW